MIFEMLVAGVVMGNFPSADKCNAAGMEMAHHESRKMPRTPYGASIGLDNGDWVARFDGREIFRAHCREAE